MCVIVYKPAGKTIGRDILKLCWDKNPDGGGLMYALNGRLKIIRGMMDWGKYEEILDDKIGDMIESVPMIFHFRIATHGSVKPANCHPFVVNKGIAMAHNGVLTCVDVPKNEDVSDTEMFIRSFLGPLSSRMTGGLKIDDLKNDALNTMIQKTISGNKLAFMDKRGEVAIINESMGMWGSAGDDGYEGVWFSNRTWKPTTIVCSGNFGSSAYGYGSGYRYGGLSLWDKEESNPFDRKAKDNYYCLDCSAYFKRGESKIIRWDALGAEMVDCPECESHNTMIEHELFEQIDYDGRWRCFDCDQTFDGPSAQDIQIACEPRKICPFCRGVRTYESELRPLVDRFTDSFFEAEYIERSDEGAK
jgi:hypothetical protein